MPKLLRNVDTVNPSVSRTLMSARTGEGWRSGIPGCLRREAGRLINERRCHCQERVRFPDVRTLSARQWEENTATRYPAATRQSPRFRSPVQQ